MTIDISETLVNIIFFAFSLGAGAVAAYFVCVTVIFGMALAFDAWQEKRLRSRRQSKEDSSRG